MANKKKRPSKRRRTVRRKRRNERRARKSAEGHVYPSEISNERDPAQKLWKKLEYVIQRRNTDTKLDKFSRDRRHLQNVYDIWVNPFEDDERQHDAFKRFWSAMEEYRFDISDFDWRQFAVDYPLADLVLD